MSFLVIVLLLLLQHQRRCLPFAQLDGLWQRWRQRVEQLPWQRWSWLQLLALLLPVLPVWLLSWSLGSVLYGLALLPVDLLVLLWAAGEVDPRPRLRPFRDSWRRGDVEGASLHAGQAIGPQGHDADSLLRHVQGYLLWHCYQSLFAVLFCYAVGGAPLALAYRLLAMTVGDAGERLRDLAAVLRQALDWLPVRLLALSFALAGNFTAVGRILWARLFDLSASPARLVVECGRTASELPARVAPAADPCTLDELWALLVRAAVVWYCAWALWMILV